MLLLKLAFSIVVGVSWAVDASGDISSIDYRLPNTTHPIAYDLSLFTRIDLLDFNFNGYVKISIAVDIPTNEIVLHAKQLNISNVQLVRYSGGVPLPIALLPHKHDKRTEFLTIPTNSVTLNAGDQLLLEISYNGTLRDTNNGFYRSSYLDETGVRRKVFVYTAHVRIGHVMNTK